MIYLKLMSRKLSQQCFQAILPLGQLRYIYPDLDGADQLLLNIVADTLLADKGYDANERVIERLQTQGKTAVIPPKRNRTIPRNYDRDLYKARHLIENFFAKLKQYRVVN